jgi:transposase InsO family protein
MAARAAYVARHLSAVDVPLSVATAAASEPEAEAINPSAAEQRDSRLAILAAVDRFAAAAGISRKRAEALFCAAYETRTAEVAPWVRAAVRSLTPRTLARWRAAQAAGATHRLAVDRGAARRGQGVLEIAGNGKVKVFCIALLARNPLLAAPDVLKAVAGEFGDTLDIVDVDTGEVVAEPIPSLRTFQAALKAWKTTHEVELTALTDPDGYRNKYALSGRGAMSHVRRVNQLWMIDASPLDMMCVDGRHSIYIAIDIYSRRIMIYVTRTPRSEAVGLLLRRCILEWGVPEAVKTDNGSDFVARYSQRVIASLGIERITSNAFQPQEKGHIERAIGTVQRSFVRLLPGFIGHSVADRKKIEARKSFAQRLGQDLKEALSVELTAADVQRYADEWVRLDYARKPHGGLKGATPAEVAAASTAPTRQVDMRALDMLLAPVADRGGIRTVTKYGIRVALHDYLAPFLKVGTDVLVRMDPADMGIAYLFAPDGEEFLGVAENANLLGIDPKQAVAAAKEEHRRIMAEGLAPLRKEARRQTSGPRLIDLALRHKGREAGNLVDFPKRTEAHTTPALDAAALAAAPAPAAPAMPEKLQTLRAQLQAEAVAPAVTALPETPRQRWRRAEALERALAAGMPISAEDALWLGGYREGHEYKGFRSTYGDAAGGAG